MNDVFIDTSAIYAALVADDRVHQAARSALAGLRKQRARLVSSSFVVQETIALLQARIGVKAVRAFHEAFLPLLEVVWITEKHYRLAMTSLLAASARDKSLADWSSIEIMRDQGIRRVVAFDRHFVGQGFEVIPEPSSRQPH